MSGSSTDKRRTLVIWLFIAVAIIAGLNAFFDAARYLKLLPVSLGEMKFFLPSVSWLGAFMSGITGVIWLTVAKWLYDLNPQGWLFVVVMAILNIVLLLLAVLGQTSFSTVAFGLAVNALALILAFLPGTQKAFGRA